MDEPQYDDGLLTEEAPAAPVNPFDGLTPEQFVAAVTSGENLVPLLSDDRLREIATQALDDWKLDKDSQSEWREQMERGLKLAQMVKERKTYPFDNASNVVYPLVTTAALQFNARAYPAIVSPDQVVKAKVWGRDPDGRKAARAARVSEHMSWQLSSRIPEWEEETDTLLTLLPITGDMVRKWWWDPVLGRARCRLVDPGRFVVNDKVKVLEDAPRLTEELALYPAEIETRTRSGQFVPCDYDDTGEDKQAAQEFIEQHALLDLDGDGYPEPYVVTVHVERQKVVRIVADFRPRDVAFRRETQMVPQTMPVPMLDPMSAQPIIDPMTGQPVIVPMQQMVPQEVVTGILSIRRGTYFVPFKFAPGMNGGHHGTGLGLLLGDISESVNGILNMLLDAGHYASLGGGFIGAELRMKGGAQRMRPGEWRMITGLGQDARSAIVPLTFPGPDATLFQMLGLLIDAGREIASVKDIMTGDAGGRTQTATTTMALIEQGMALFSAAYKRIFRALKSEYRLLARINAETVDPAEYNAFHDNPQGQFDPAADYDDRNMDVEPVADPRSVTKMQQAAKAQTLMEWAGMGLVNPAAAVMRAAEAIGIEEMEELIPQPDPMAAQMAEMQGAMMRAELTEKAAKIELTLAQINAEKAKAVKTMAEADALAIQLRLDETAMILEDERARLADLLRSLGGMAGAPGNGGAAGGNAPGPAGPQGAPLASLLGGQAASGGGAPGLPPGGAMGGRVL